MLEDMDPMDQALFKQSLAAVIIEESSEDDSQLVITLEMKDGQRITYPEPLDFYDALGIAQQFVECMDLGGVAISAPWIAQNRLNDIGAARLYKMSQGKL